MTSGDKELTDKRAIPGFWTIFGGVFAGMMLWTVVTRWINEIRFEEFALTSLGGWDTAALLIALTLSAAFVEVAKG